MGLLYSSTYYKSKMPDDVPKANSKPLFDPHYGFTAKRVERKMELTEQELRALRIPKKYWDYCVHLRKDLMTCQKNNLPFFNLFCRKELALYQHCRHEDYVMRMKEYEREKRLLARQKKLEEKSIQ